MKYQSRKKVVTYHVFSKTSKVESCLIKSYGNALLEIFRKNSYSEYSQKTFCTKVFFLQRSLQLYGFYYWGFHYSGCILLAIQYNWIHTLLHNWSVAGRRRSENMIISCIVFNWWKVVNGLVCNGSLKLYSCYYYSFKVGLSRLRNILPN